MNKQLLILNDGRTFEFFTTFVKIENPLGAVRGILKEYTLSEIPLEVEKPVYKLYKTKDGYWYDNSSAERPNLLLMMVLKAALDEKERREVVEHWSSDDDEESISA